MLRIEPGQIWARVHGPAGQVRVIQVSDAVKHGGLGPVMVATKTGPQEMHCNTLRAAFRLLWRPSDSAAPDSAKQ